MIVAGLFPPMDPARRAAIEADIAQFAKLVPTLGTSATFEDAGMRCVDVVRRYRIRRAARARKARRGWR